jgi:hypothetical protein
MFLAARDQPREELGSRLSEAIAAIEPAEPGLFLRLADDPFAAFSPGARGFDATIEVPFPASFPERADPPEWLSSLGERLEPLVHRDLSAAVCGPEHHFVPGGPSPVRYQYLMRRRSGWDHARYLAHYGTVHADIGTRTPGTRGYSQLHVEPSASAQLAAALGFGVWRIDSVSRLWLDTIDEFLRESTRSGVGAEALADEEGFVDRPNSVMFASESLR